MHRHTEDICALLYFCRGPKVILLEYTQIVIEYMVLKEIGKMTVNMDYYPEISNFLQFHKSR